MRKIVSKLTIFIPIILFLISPFQIFASDIVINEFQVKPSNMQWVELYNKGEQPIDISGWIIDDSGSISEKYTIEDGINLPSRKCISFQSGKFNFNTTSNDSAKLIAKDGIEIIDSYSYSITPTPGLGDNISFGRSVDGGDTWVTFNNPSRDKLNSTGEVCLVPTPTPTPTVTPSPTPSSPTNTPAATPQPQSNPTVRPLATPTKKPGVTPRVYDPDAEVVTPRQEPTGVVLGETTNSTDVGNEKPTHNRQGVSLLLLLLLMGGGVGCIVGAVILSTKQIRRRRQFNL